MTEKKFEIVCPPELMKKIEDHCFSAVDVEVGGFLVGRVEDGKSIVTHVLKAKNTSAQSTQLTFTNKTWETAWSEISAISKDAKLVGWFHSHPNFGVFLSDYDKFIQNQFFHEDGMITIVVDPIRGKRGWFISIDKEVRPYAPEEDTSREKLGESKKDADANIDAIIERSRESKGGISTGRTIAIAALFSVFSLIGGYSLTSLQLVDYKGQIERLQGEVSFLKGELDAAQNVNPTPEPTNTGAPAPTSTSTASSKSSTSTKGKSTSSSKSDVVAEGSKCPIEKLNKTQTGKDGVGYICTKTGKESAVWKKYEKKSSTGTSDTKTSPSAKSTASPTAIKSPAPQGGSTPDGSKTGTSSEKPSTTKSEAPDSSPTPSPSASS